MCNVYEAKLDVTLENPFHGCPGTLGLMHVLQHVTIVNECMYEEVLEPGDEVENVNGDETDDRWCNLGKYDERVGRTPWSLRRRIHVED